MNTYNANLLYLCEQRGISITEFEGVIHIPKVRIMEPGPDELVKVADFFNLPIDVLVRKDLTSAKNNIPKAIKLVILDIDGTMTDGGMYFMEDGNQMKRYNAKDGLAIMKKVKEGVKFGIISHGRKLNMVQDRAKLLGIEKVYVGTEDKVTVLENWIKELNIAPNEIAFIGDDENDLPIMKYVGLSACPSDGVKTVKSAVDIVLSKAGGQGCVREFIDNWLD